MIFLLHYRNFYKVLSLSTLLHEKNKVSYMYIVHIQDIPNSIQYNILPLIPQDRHLLSHFQTQFGLDPGNKPGMLCLFVPQSV